jgi:serine/threonine protein kinase
MKIIINPEYQQYRNFIESIPERFGKEGEVIHKERNEIRVFEENGEKLNVKRYRKPNLLNRIVYRFFRQPKAQRAYNNALKIKEKEINTPAPIAYIIRYRGGLMCESYFVSKQVAYRRNMYEFGKGGIAGREHILRAFALFTAKLHQSDICHRDYSPGNILFDAENGEVQFCLVDINRMEFGEVSVEKGCKNFARLWGQQPMFEYVARIYAETRNADIQYCTEEILRGCAKFWKRYLRRHKEALKEIEV